MHHMNQVRPEVGEIVEDVIFNFLIEIFLEMKKVIAFAERDSMDRQPLECRIPGTQTIEHVRRFGWFVTNEEDLMAALHSLAG